MTALPELGNVFVDMSKSLIDQLSNAWSKLNATREQLKSKIVCQLAITEYEGGNY